MRNMKNKKQFRKIRDETETYPISELYRLFDNSEKYHSKYTSPTARERKYLQIIR